MENTYTMELGRKWANGCTVSYNRLFSYYYDTLLVRAARITSYDTDEARDLVHDTFEKLTKKVFNKGVDIKFLAYFTRCMNNTFIDRKRAEKRKRKYMGSVQELNEDTALVPDSESVKDKIVEEEMIEKLYELINSDDIDRKDTILLRLTGMSYSEIAGCRGKSINTCLGHMRYFIASLKRDPIKLQKLKEMYIK